MKFYHQRSQRSVTYDLLIGLQLLLQRLQLFDLRQNGYVFKIGEASSQNRNLVDLIKLKENSLTSLPWRFAPLETAAEVPRLHLFFIIVVCF